MRQTMGGGSDVYNVFLVTRSEVCVQLIRLQQYTHAANIDQLLVVEFNQTKLLNTHKMQARHMLLL